MRFTRSDPRGSKSFPLCPERQGNHLHYSFTQVVEYKARLVVSLSHRSLRISTLSSKFHLIQLRSRGKYTMALNLEVLAGFTRRPILTRHVILSLDFPPLPPCHPPGPELYSLYQWFLIPLPTFSILPNIYVEAGSRYVYSRRAARYVARRPVIVFSMAATKMGTMTTISTVGGSII